MASGAPAAPAGVAPVPYQKDSQGSDGNKKSGPSWLIAIILLIIGLLIGAGVMFFVKQAGENEAAAEEEAALDERAVALDNRDQELDAREDDLKASQDELTALQDKLREDAVALEEERDELAAQVEELSNQDPFDAAEMTPGIEPGKFEVTGADSCYWARVSSDDPTASDIIAEGLIRGDGTITVADDDAGLKTLNCGELVKVEEPETDGDE